MRESCVGVALGRSGWFCDANQLAIKTLPERRLRSFILSQRENKGTWRNETSSQQFETHRESVSSYF